MWILLSSKHYFTSFLYSFRGYIYIGILWWCRLSAVPGNGQRRRKEQLQFVRRLWLKHPWHSSCVRDPLPWENLGDLLIRQAEWGGQSGGSSYFLQLSISVSVIYKNIYLQNYSYGTSWPIFLYFYCKIKVWSWEHIEMHCDTGIWTCAGWGGFGLGPGQTKAEHHSIAHNEHNSHTRQVGCHSDR